MKKWLKLIPIILFIALIISACIPSEAASNTQTDMGTDSNTEECETSTQKALLTMYLPDGETEQIIFSYTSKGIYNSGIYCEYHDCTRDGYTPVVYVSGGVVYFNITSREDFDVFSGTFTIQNITD